jgi:hypothetical protein
VETLWALANINKDCSLSLKKSWLVKIILEQNLNNLLTKFGTDLPTLKSLLTLYPKSILSGSIIAQAFLGVEWEDSDLDIYLPWDDTWYVDPDFIVQRYEDRWKLVNKFVRPNLIDDRVQHYRTLKHGRYLPKYVKYIYEARTERKGKIIQFIFLDFTKAPRPNKATTCSFVIPKFDLSMIQNWFDGAFHFRYVKHLLTKEMRTTNSKWVGKRILPRIKKYQLRGFTFKMTGRKRKYVSRTNLQYFSKIMKR